MIHLTANNLHKLNKTQQKYKNTTQLELNVNEVNNLFKFNKNIGNLPDKKISYDQKMKRTSKRNEIKLPYYQDC